MATEAVGSTTAPAVAAQQLTIEPSQVQRERLKRIDWPLSLTQRDANRDDSSTFSDLQSTCYPFHEVKFQHHCCVDLKRFPNLNKVIFVRAEDYPKFAALSLKYCAVQKAKSRRYDQERSPYQVWHEDADRIVDEAVMSYTQYNRNAVGGFWAASEIEQEAELQWRLDTIPCPHLFPVAIATTIYKTFGSKKILDISSGWGDRLLAACAVGAHYYGCDPNTELRSCYDAVVRDHGEAGKQVVRTACFEKDDENPVEQFPCVADGSGGYDTLFSSIPFWLLEIYSEEESQSVKQYPDVKQWTRNFVLKSLFKCNLALAPGANVVLHLSDIISRDKEKHPDFFYVQDVLHVCSSVLRWEFQGTFGYKRCKNDQFVTKNDALLAQAMFWFRKPAVAAAN